MSAVGLLNVLLLVDSYARAAAFCVVFSNLICEVSGAGRLLVFFGICREFNPCSPLKSGDCRVQS